MKQRSFLLRLHNLSSFETNEHETFDTIFREAENNGKSVSPTVAKATPINDALGSPNDNFPSIVEFDTVEESADIPDDISGEWAIEDDDGKSSSNDFYPIQTVTPLAADTQPSLYSFYFEDTIMNLSEDDNSVSLHDDVSLEDADYCLDNIRDNPEGFWSDSALMMTQERRSSPTHISLSSDGFAQIHRVDSL